MSEGFTKHRAGPVAEHFFATEAAGLDWIRTATGPPVPRVLGRTSTSITIERIRTGAPSARAARTLGGELAALHRHGAPAFGAAPPDAPGPHGWIGDLPMPYAERVTFTEFWANDRVAATARMARDRGGLSGAQAREVDGFVEDLLDDQVDVGPAERPARLHGDLWSGNVLWAGEGRAWLIDPAAHGGHRESDLAMLALFGAPHLETVLAGYDEAAPLAPGWRERLPLHQVWPLLVHATLFGGGYADSAVRAVRRARG